MVEDGYEWRRRKMEGGREIGRRKVKKAFELDKMKKGGRERWLYGEPPGERNEKFFDFSS